MVHCHCQWHLPGSHCHGARRRLALPLAAVQCNHEYDSTRKKKIGRYHFLILQLVCNCVPGASSLPDPPHTCLNARRHFLLLTSETSYTCFAGSFSRWHLPCRALHASHSAARTRWRCVGAATALFFGPLAPPHFCTFTVMWAGGAPRVRAHFVPCPPPPPTSSPDFVPARAATASTCRFGLQPPSAAVVTLPAGLSVRLRRAHDVWDVVEVPPPILHFAALISLSCAASSRLPPSLVCRPAVSQRPPSRALVIL